MGLLNRLRRPYRSKGSRRPVSVLESSNPPATASLSIAPRDSLARRLPPSVLANIFTFVCPHSADDTYNASDESVSGDGCASCHMRDLAHCVMVCRRWSAGAQKLLYSHVRIEAVHYCDLEAELAAKRKRRSFFDRNAIPTDAADARLALFMRSVRDDPELAALVLSLRTPFMMREANRSGIARTVSVLPNLRYVDLPSGVYSDELSCSVLKQELMARCPDIRRMSYRHGAEETFSELSESLVWTNLEVLEVSGLQIETRALRLVLGSLPNLRDLALKDLPWLDDSSLGPLQALPSFPAVQGLCFVDTPNITVDSILLLLSAPANAKALRSLTLSSTGVTPSSLHRILSVTSHLRELLVTQEVSQIFPESTPPLLSDSLRLLHYEIISFAQRYGARLVSDSYYTYLIESLKSGSLSALQNLYVRDTKFPESLLALPLRPARPRRSNLHQPLNVYSKGAGESEWIFTAYNSHSVGGQQSSISQPVIHHNAQYIRAWNGRDARKSIMIDNGFGGFLAAPEEAERQRTSMVAGSI